VGIRSREKRRAPEGRKKFNVEQLLAELLSPLQGSLVFV
jgi:hypothetical protein